MKKIFTLLIMILITMVPSMNIRAEEAKSEAERIDQAEDKNIAKIMNGLNVMSAGPGYPGEYYIKNEYGVIKEDIKYDSFVNKLQKAVEEYNNCHDIEIEWKKRDDTVKAYYFSIYSKNLSYLENPVSYIGETAYIRKGEWLYWECSQDFGKGKSGTIFSDGLTAVTVKGVSYLDAEGNNISASFEEAEEIDWGKIRMLLIFDEKGTNLGWIYHTYLTGEND